MTNELTQDQFRSTMTEKMMDVTNSAEPVIDIWSYVEILVSQNTVVEFVFNNHLVDSVFRNLGNTFDHILLPTDRPDIFIVIIVDLIGKQIIGHYRLDLDKEYGLS